LLPQNSPAGEGFDQALGNLQGIQFCGVHPSRFRGVIARAQRATGNRGHVIPDVDHGLVKARPLYPAEQAAHLDGEARLLEHLPDQRVGIRFTWLDTPAGDGPEPGGRLVPALDHQQAALPVRHDGAYARDDRAGHAVIIDLVRREGNRGMTPAWYRRNYSEVLWCTTRHLWPDLHTYF
jgi:hypothetical protein